MAHRIEVVQKIPDTRAQVRKRELDANGFSEKVDNVELVDVYTFEADLEEGDLERVIDMLANPVFQEGRINDSFQPKFDYAVEIGFLPGVTDNVGNTVREGVSDLLKRKLNGQTAYSSQLMFLSGSLTREDAQIIGESLANPLIQRIQVRGYDEFAANGGMGVNVPRVRISEKPGAGLVDLLNVSEDELVAIGKQGIVNADGTRRGPLALDLTYMKTIRGYFESQGRNPTDMELESIAQTWSEHCKHTIFADPIDEFTEGLYKQFIKRATKVVRTTKGDRDFCVSVFSDNAGAIDFDENHLITDKVETHNSPSALDPFGGAITGIVGVNRDAIGFGLGSKPVVNRYGFCFADPEDERPLYKGANKTQRMLSPRRIMDGVIAGVNSGGNQSGIPSPQGFIYFDERFKGKPLVFVGTLGLIPRESAGRVSHEKEARPGDYVVMVGGRVGKDGIHGATFSSEAIDSGSPATAVQIGDPITQKKLSDAILKEARDRELYTSITDNGAGGLSCSVPEMAKESGGCYVDLNKVPLKYPGLQPWEIWVSESQERMTLSVPKEKWNELSGLMQRRGVEATVIGEFTDSGKCVVDYDGRKVMDVEMNFLHEGLPKRPIKTTFTRQRHEEPDFSELENLTGTMHSMLRRKNIASFEFISQQYDHEVQGGSVLKPLQGRGRVNGDATIVRPVLGSNKGIVISQGLNPSYSDIDTYNMAAAAIDTAIRNAVAVGANLDRIALLDNFCWCSSTEPERLGQLKRAVQACYDAAVAYGTPFISGKDSMFNDFKGFDENGNPVKISVPPTLLVSSIAVMDDVRKAVSLDAKIPGDFVYVLGENSEELGGSEYFAMMGEQLRGQRFIGNNVPDVRLAENRILYEKFFQALDQELIASSQSIHRGGLGIALAKIAMGGRLGMEVSLGELRDVEMRDDFALYSESQGRLVVTVNPDYASEFESVVKGGSVARIGVIRADDRFIIDGRRGKVVVETSINDMLNSYKSTFRSY
ncbi:MAG: AIR synthase-related protein [Candidatus Pacearchaeota archaeon]|nr:AIR synthase-related protein [Candidatus Pacearchaeota archaeon]